ncbi:MAG: metallophosphoesterase family protein [Saprospiraceae bacterium]
MKKLTAFLSLTIVFFGFLSAQTIKVQPYLQDASPNSIYILWETDSLSESVVEWGLTVSLGNTTSGTAQYSVGEAMIHEVKLDNLERFTKYYYRVRTGNAISGIYNFKTPPFASDQESFRIIAMSDMQRDGSFPNKFNEIVHDGIIDYLNSEFGGELIDNVAFVMIPGDLVVTGSNYTQWKEHFFDPSHDLFSHVPVYPVLGNHEQNSTYYFQYFKMPENGTSGFEEHWWHKDYGNVRIIGLDSNSPFDNQEQLEWLEGVLEMTCNADSIDFVFAQLHHPHKSELWTPGESSYTGEVIERLEQFSTDCGKPSIHFFGHTHGYSRGNSRDHKHLWINVATAGGAIDNWGEFPNFDYDEFSISQDEYGFVSVEITNDTSPKVVVKRISRGDQNGILANVLTDSVTFRLMPSFVNIPTPISPNNEEIAPECVVLDANAFTSTNAMALHGQSHWQVSTMEKMTFCSCCRKLEKF